MKFDFKADVLPHFLAISSFYLIVVLYFSPIVFEGKMIFQTDILQWEGSAKEILDYRESTGEQALWTNRMFGGMPAYLIHLDPKGDITNFLIKALTFGLPHPISALFFGMVSMYLLLICFKVRPYIAIIGAWAFAFNTFNFLSLEAGHNAKIWAIGIVPLLLAGVHLAFNGKKLLGIVITAFAVLLQLKFNHLQITYYTLLLVIVYGIGQLVIAYQQKHLPAFAKITAILLVAAVIGAMGHAARLSSVLEYGTYSIRGERNLPIEEQNDTGLDKEYAFNWSNGKLETFTLLIPNYFGGASQGEVPKNSASEKALRSNGVDNAQVNQFLNGAPTYWGDQPFTGGPIYGGAVMIFLFILAIIFSPPLYRNVFLSMVVLTLMLSWGKNLAWFNYAIFDYLPGYNKFRAVSMALGMTLFVIPLFGAIGLENLVERIGNKESLKPFLIGTGISLGLILVGIVFASWAGYQSSAGNPGYPDWLMEALKSDRKSLLMSDAFRSAMFILIPAILIGLVYYNKLKSNYALLGIGLVVLIDLWGVNSRYLDADSFIEDPSEQHFAATPADNKISADKGYFRVLNIQNPFNDARTSYRFNSIGGYHGAKMSRYGDLIDRILLSEINGFVKKAQEGNFDYQSIQRLNMLNTKYLLAGRAENAVFLNPEANGPAWFPEKIANTDSNEEEIETLAKINTKETATYNAQDNGNQSLGAGNGTIKLENYAPDALSYKASVEKSGLAVFSEIFYPKGWKAFVDGQETPILRVNYLLRGLVLPEGAHTVEMRFEPSAYYNWEMVAVIVQYLVVLSLLFAVYKNFNSKQDLTDKYD
ncbi:YfhO family protein [Cyclobacterium sp. 1_MG-2023]|uniref:YfhO family protein n=1 Tax=Cyclobacterium sp. 1_MG-2023 TaxID=3062681 RepID=UPI0026E213C5|nr:YfhO family protein [Cyclobacterium sp. 1_MG-2023]MDO6436477.1 YfhO family protein [Cyclobacterium sp. 1_MG-2023]